MYILGINAYHGDSSACIMRDGVIVAAIEEERFRRIKHWAGFPSNSIKFCLKEAGIILDELDYITISRDPKANFLKKIMYLCTKGFSFKNTLSRIINLKKIRSLEYQFMQEFDIDNIESMRKKIRNIEHHRSHIASAFFASDFNDSAILSIDGFGDFTSTMTALGNSNNISILDSLNFPHSLGIFYTAATQFLGFFNYGDEYKVMGLAPYGEPRFVDKINEIIYPTADGFFRLEEKYFLHVKQGVDMNFNNQEPLIQKLFTSEWETLIGTLRSPNEEVKKDHLDFARSVQVVTENIIFHVLKNLYDKTGVKNICIAGGVAQNSVANGKILLNTPFENIYIPSAAHDAGTSIGSTFYLYNHILKNKRLPAMKHAYLGSQTNNEEVITYLNKQNISYIKLEGDKLFDYVSSKLCDGLVVGWFQGNSEFGPRALGNRSILVDPRRTDAKELLNKKIKKREEFRPFAPSILKEYIDEYFEQTDEVPFMEQVFQIKKEKHSLIPAVTHIDGSGRLQTVDKNSSPKYYNLISAFYEKTDIPVLLNTSFNENEPIVNSVSDALNCFLRTNMDMLVIEDIIIERFITDNEFDKNLW